MGEVEKELDAQLERAHSMSSNYSDAQMEQVAAALTAASTSLQNARIGFARGFAHDCNARVRPWSDIERHAVLDEAPDYMRLALALMMFTGLGRKDALTLPRNFVKAGEIATRRAKTGEPVFRPMPSQLATILDQAPSHNATTLCANSKGRPWTLSGFSTMADLAHSARK